MDTKHHFSTSSVISKRRTNKPLVEKKRRERINKSLEELKKLVLQDLQKDTEEFEKMEKADILEMAVNHLKSIKNRQTHSDVRALGQPDSHSRYRTGYNECATEVMRYLNVATPVSTRPSVKGRLVDHISSCVQRVNTCSSTLPRLAAVSTYTPTAAAQQSSTPCSTPSSSLPGSSGRLSSFTPVRKSPIEAVEAPHLDFLSPSYDTSLASTSGCVSPEHFSMNFMMSPFSAVQSPSTSHCLPRNTSSRSRSVSPNSLRHASVAGQPAFMAAMDIEEIRAKYGDVWRPW